MKEENKELKELKNKDIKGDMKKIQKIIFLPNEEITEDWTDHKVTPEEHRILKEGEDYIDKTLIPSLSIYQKPKIGKAKTLKESEILEIDKLLKEKAKALKLKEQTEEEKAKILKEKEDEENEKKKQQEIDRMR